MRILMIDDNTETCELLTQARERFSDTYGTKTAASAEDALDSVIESYATGNPYTFICLKHPMPSMDGLEIIRRLRLCEQTHPQISSRCMVCVISTVSGCQQQFFDALGYDPYLTFMPQSANLPELLTLVREHHVAPDSTRPIAPKPSVAPSFSAYRPISCCA